MLQFGKPEVYEPQIVMSDQTSSNTNGSVLTLLSNAQLSLQPGQPELACSQILTLRVPVEACDTTSVVGYLVHLRGSVARSAGARVVLTAALGGGNAVFEWPYAQLPAGEDLTPISEEFFHELFSLERRPNREENPGGFYALPPLSITVLLTAQRRTAEDVVMATLDSIDVRAVLG